MKLARLICQIPIFFLITACGIWYPPKQGSTPSSVTPTPGPSSLYKDFPLKLGATWVYSVSVEFGRLDDSGKFETVKQSGTITQTLTETKSIAKEQSFVFSYEQNPKDTISDPELDKEYTVKENSVFIHNRETLQFPLEVGREWNPFGVKFDDAKPGWYVWHVTARENVAMTNRLFSDCYQLELLTQPDRTFLSFCPKIGIVKREYLHGGLGYVELWELQDAHIP